MSVQRKRYSAQLKARIALEAIKGHRTANEIAAEYGVHPTQIAQWKKQALDGLPDLFSSQAGKAEKTEAALIASRKTVVEGYKTTAAFASLCAARKIDAPILREIQAVLSDGKKPAAAIAALMSRELKREHLRAEVAGR